MNPTLLRPTRRRTFYVDATGGNDANDGRHPSAAWQTVAAIHAATFQRGDHVRFKCGETWLLTERLQADDGVIYGAYGAGAKPILDGQDTVDCVLVSGKSHVRFENLSFRSGLDACLQVISSNDVAIVECDTEGAGNDNILFITNCTNCSVQGGTHATPYQRVGGTLVTCIEITDGGSGFLIDGVECSGSPAAGISVHNHSAADPQGRTDFPTLVWLHDCNCHDNSGNGIQVMSQDTSTTPVILISDCVLDTNDTGVRVYKTAGSTYYPQGVTLETCRMVDNVSFGFYFQADDCAIRRCVTAGTTQQNRILECKRITFYNNTVWLSPAAALWPLYIMGGARVDTITVRNCIFFMDTTSGQMVGTAAASSTGVTFDYNWYFFRTYGVQARWQWNANSYTYANWLINSAQDAHSSPTPSTDPSFTNAAIYDFTLQVTSDAIDAGVEIAGVTDGFLGDAPDCGYVETA